MFNWASSVPRFGSNIRNGSERLGWAINLGWTINLSWTINLVLIIRLWAILIFFCLSSFSTAQSTKLASQPARPSLISASLAPAAVVDHKVVGDKSKAVELKLPKAVIQALKKGTPDYGVKTEVLRAVKLKPYSKIGVSSRTLDNMANPSRTHQVDASKSPTIDETKSKPTALKNGANDDTIVARSIRIKSPGQQALDSVNIALPSISRASETGKGSKIFAPRRVGFDTKATSTALDSIQRKVQSVLPDTARPDVDSKTTKQQDLNSINGINPAQAKPEATGGTAAVTPKVVVRPDSVEQKSSVAPNSIEQKTAVAPNSIEQKAAVNPDNIKQQAAVNPDNIKQQAAVNPNSIEQKTAVAPNSVEQKAAVDPDSIKQKAAVNPDSIKQKAAVNPDSIKQQAAVDPDSIKQQVAVNPDSIKQQAAVDSDSIEQKAAVDPDSIKQQAAVDPDSIEQKAAVDPDSIEQKAAVDPESIEQKAAVDTASIKKKAAVDTDSIKKKAAVDKSAIEAKGTVDLSANFKAINKAASGSISGAISGKASSSVSVTDDGIDSSTINTDSVSNALDKQAKQFGAKGDTDRNAADNVGVPAVTQDCVRKKRVLGFIGRKYCSKHAPNPASVAANSTALAKKKNLNERAKGNYNAANKIDKKRDDLIATQGGYSSEDALPASSSYGGVNTAVTGSQQDRSANQSDTQQHQKNTHNPYALNHDASKHRILELSGTRDFIIALGDINASIGLDSEAIQQIATVQGNVRGSPSFNVIPLTTRSDLVNASIGYKSLARQAIDQLGDNDRDTNVPNGAVTFSGETVGGVNASIGSDSKAYHLQSLVSGTFTGAKVFSMSDGFVNASIGSDTTSKLRLSVFQGQAPSGSLDLMSAAAGIVVAAIGHKSTANFSAASGENVTSVGNVKLHAVAPGAIVASIGSNTSATTLLASATGASASAMDVSVTGLLPSIAAAIGVNSEAHNTVAVLRENVEVGGEWQANIVYGQLTAFSLGNNTNAINEIGVISANVSGDIKQQIVVGAMLAGTLGSNTESTNKVGNVEARVNGNVTTNINILDVNTLSLGLTSGVDRKIYARTSIGNVFPNSSGSAYGTIKKDITITGPIINLGIGLIIDLGFLGVLDLSAPGCVNIGNNGTNPC